MPCKGLWEIHYSRLNRKFLQSSFIPSFMLTRVFSKVVFSQLVGKTSTRTIRSIWLIYSLILQLTWRYVWTRAFLKTHSRLVYCKARDSSIARSERSPNPHLCRICNTVVGATTNPLLALKTKLTDCCSGGSPSRLAINEFHSFRNLVINESWLYCFIHFSQLLLTQK